MSNEDRGRKRSPKQIIKSQPAASSSNPFPFSGNKSLGIDASQPSPTQLHIPEPSSPITPNRFVEPTHIPNPSDPSRTICVYSNRDGKGVWTEVEAILVRDLSESWISDRCVERKNLRILPKSRAPDKYGHLGTKTVAFAGKTNLLWTEKGCHKSHETICQIVENGSFDIYLPYDLVYPKLSVPPVRPSSSKTQNFQPFSAPILSLEAPPLTPKVPVVGSFDGSMLEGEPDDTPPQCRAADVWMVRLMATHKYLDNPHGELRGASVKIAVLDTGVDSKHPFIRGAMSQKRIKKLQSFVSNDESYEDMCGHGTHVTSLLLKSAPHAHLYCAKIANSEKISLDHNIAQAIEWATNLDVDIITMSFGLEKDDPYIHQAILTAHSKNIIMFAAASNNGGNDEVTYPAKYDEVICVFSTDGLGNFSPCNPNKLKKSGYQFAALGQAVNSAWLTKSSGGKVAERRKTGTSLATPIVAGIAACVLEFALMNDMEEETYRILRRQRGMREIMAKHLSEKRGGLDYICPWKLFGKERKKEVILTLVKDCLHG